MPVTETDETNWKQGETDAFLPVLFPCENQLVFFCSFSGRSGLSHSRAHGNRDILFWIVKVIIGKKRGMLMHGKIFLRDIKISLLNVKKCLTVWRECAILLLPLKGFIFCAKIWPDSFPAKPFWRKYLWKDHERSSFLREAEQSDYTGGAEHESKNHIGLLGVQAAQLQHNEKQEKRSRQTGNEQVLPFLQKTHDS